MSSMKVFNCSETITNGESQGSGRLLFSALVKNVNCVPVVKTKMMVRICREFHATLTNLFWL